MINAPSTKLAADVQLKVPVAISLA